jgi:beta-galactosidase
MGKFIRFFCALSVVLPLASSQSQIPKFDTILYGAAFYEEYMPTDRLEEDVRLMREAGISVVRLGESTWTSWEPREGEFQFAWMERILNRLHKAGIKVILGTPTYSIPPWMYGHAPRPGERRLAVLRPAPEHGHHQSDLSIL